MKPSLYGNIQAKRERIKEGSGEKMRKPGTKGAPTAAAFKAAAKTAKKGQVMKDTRLARAGVSGYNKPKRTPDHPTKSHVVVAKEGDQVKTIRFGQQGVTGSPDGSKRNEAFKARHAKNIAKGKMSAAWWADEVKWK
jgi:hypothetical protein